MKKMKSNILSIAAKVVTVSECEKNKEIISKTTNFAIMRQLLSRIVFVANSIVMHMQRFQLSTKSFILRFLRRNSDVSFVTTFLTVQVSRISFQMPLNESRRALQLCSTGNLVFWVKKACFS